MNSPNPRVLGWTFVLAALSDWGIGGALLFLPKYLVPLLGLPSAENDVYIRLVGLLLVVVGLYYFVTSIDPERHAGNVAVALLGRVLGPIFYLIYIFAFNGEPIFWAFVILNIAFGVAHIWAIGPSPWSWLRAALGKEKTGSFAHARGPERQSGAM
jgi:hypothetical protein